jgi:hypothetical protein
VKLRHTLGLMVALFFIVPQLAFATPPDHAPAHGYRAKQAKKAPEPAPSQPGIEIIFDSERGIHVAVGVPGILFHDGHYYRERDGRWEVSMTGDGGWSFSASSGVPEVVVKAKNQHPGPAKKAKSKKHK